MPVDIPVKVLWLRIADTRWQFYQLCILGGHVNGNISGNSLLLVCQPFDGTGVHQRRHPDRSSVHIDLGIDAAHFKLRNHVHHAAHFPISQKLCGIFIQKGNLVIIDFFDVLCKIPVFRLQKFLVLSRIHNGGWQNCSNQIDQQYCRKQPKNQLDTFLLLCLCQYAKTYFFPWFHRSLHQHLSQKHSQQNENQHPEPAGVNVDGRQGNVIVKAH